MRNEVDKSLKEVWDMKEAAHERFLCSGFRNYAEYLIFRQKQIDEALSNRINEKVDCIAL